MQPATLHSLIETALDDGMNMKRLLIVTGLDTHDFLLHHNDMLFNYEQELALIAEIENWMEGLR